MANEDVSENLVILRNDPEAAEFVGIIIWLGRNITDLKLGQRVFFIRPGGHWIDVPGSDFSIFITPRQFINRVMADE